MNEGLADAVLTTAELILKLKSNLPIERDELRLAVATQLAAHHGELSGPHRDSEGLAKRVIELGSQAAVAYEGRIAPP